jgi:two-component system, NarL family, nitrate/nitrite response regulator NarL
LGTPRDRGMGKRRDRQKGAGVRRGSRAAPTGRVGPKARIEEAGDGAPASRVLIVEDHKLFAEVIAPALRKSGMRVLDPVEDGAAALDAVAREAPDMVLIDLGLPDMDGLDLGRRILLEHGGTRVVAVTAFRDPGRIQQALRAGFHGYLDKETPLPQFVRAVRAAMEGEVVVRNSTERRGADDRSEHERFVDLLREQLTPREYDVLALLVEGASTKGMARRLGVSPNTVRTHVQNVLEKLQVRSRLEAVAFAVRYGLIAKSEELQHG